MGIGQPFRLEPAGPAAAYSTFQATMAKGPQFERKATCEEVECEAWTYGWVTRVQAGTDLEQAIRHAGRTWTSADQVDGWWSFIFAPGTPCFAASRHKTMVRPDIPQLLVVRGGDWRGNPTGERRVHTRPEDWAEHLHEHTAQLADRIEKG